MTIFLWFKSFDAAFGLLLPAFARLGLYGLVVGGIAMLIYWRLSPQARMIKFKQEMREARRAMQSYTGTDGREILRLSGRAISLALQQLLLVIGPTIVAAIPVVLVMLALGSAYTATSSWLKSWEVPFMIGLSVSALGMKFGLKIV